MLRGDKVSLRLIDKPDLEWLRNLRNKYRNEFYTSEEISKEKQVSWYERYIETKTDSMFIIEAKGERVGTIALYNVSISDRTAELGRVVITEENRGQGYAEDAVATLVKHAFTTMRLFKVKLSTYIDNTAAIALYHNCGFRSLKRPIIMMEMVNPNYSDKTPMMFTSYDDMAGDHGYEGQCDNIKEV